jgi:AraC-like DNA-binding protein
MVENNSISLFRLEGFIPFELNLIMRFVYVLPFGYCIIKIFTDKKNKPFLVEDKSNFTFIKILLTAILYAYLNFFMFLILPLIQGKINFSDSFSAGMLITAGIFILFLGMKILLSPQLLFDLKENKKKNVKTQNETKEEAIELLNRIETKMSEEKFYLNEKFSSNDVLTNFEITRSNLDDLLIQIKGINFADWLNNFRIEYSKNLLLSNDQYTIDALSNMSGFSSRSAFYAAFKKKTNITPSEYIKQSKKEL